MSSETIREAKTEDQPPKLTNGAEPLGEKRPGTPFMLVGLGYLAVLAIGCCVTAFLIWYW